MIKYEIAYRKGLDLLTEGTVKPPEFLSLYGDNKPVLFMTVGTLRDLMNLTKEPAEKKGYLIYDELNPLELKITQRVDVDRFHYDNKSVFFYNTHPPTLYHGPWVPPTGEELQESIYNHRHKKYRHIRLWFVVTPNDIFIQRRIDSILRYRIPVPDLILSRRQVQYKESTDITYDVIRKLNKDENMQVEELTRVFNGAKVGPTFSMDYNKLEQRYIDECRNIGIDIQVIKKDEIDYLLKLNDDFLIKIQI